MRGQISSVSVIAFCFSNIVCCLPGRHPLATRQCYNNVDGAVCSEVSNTYSPSTSEAAPQVKPTNAPISAASSKYHVDKLTATCDNDICSIWDVSSSVFTVITGPGYTPTNSSSVPLMTGGGSFSASSSQPPSPPFANGTNTSNDISTPTASGATAPLSTGLGTATGGTTGFVPSPTTDAIWTNSSSMSGTGFGTGASSGIAPSSTTDIMWTNTTGPINTGGTAASSGLFPTSSATTDAIWTNSTTQYGTSGWPSNSANATATQASASITYWGPWEAWTSSSGVVATGTSRPSCTDTTSCSETPTANATTTSAPVETMPTASDTNPVESMPTASDSITTLSTTAAGETSTSANPASTFTSTDAAASTTLSFNSTLTPADTTTGAPTTYSSCYTTTPTYQFETPSPSPSPTMVCWGFSCTNSSCSDWLTRIPVTAVDATSSSAPFANTTGGAHTGSDTGTGPSGTGMYPTGTGTGGMTDSPTTTSLTSIAGTVTRTVYPVSGSSGEPWVDWTSTFSTSTLSYSANDTDTTTTATSAVDPGTVTVHFSSTSTGTGGTVAPMTHPGEYYNGLGRLRQGTPGHLREVLRRRRVEDKRDEEVGMEGVAGGRAKEML